MKKKLLVVCVVLATGVSILSSFALANGRTEEKPTIHNTTTNFSRSEAFGIGKILTEQYFQLLLVDNETNFKKKLKELFYSSGYAPMGFAPARTPYQFNQIKTNFVEESTKTIASNRFIYQANVDVVLSNSNSNSGQTTQFQKGIYVDIILEKGLPKIYSIEAKTTKEEFEKMIQK